MNKEIKKLWIDALKSGEYEQGRWRLKTKNRYCCLGVLCDIYVKQTSRGSWINDVFTSEKHTEEKTLPAPVRIWAGVTSGIIADLNLVVLNDRGDSFLQISKVINLHL